VTRADAAIQDIQRRNKPVVVVGGTGLYIRALLHGVVPAPPVDAALRSELEDELGRVGAPALHRRLAKVDPQGAERIPAQDGVRIVRALELFLQTGVPASRLRADHQFAEERYPHVFWVLWPEREALYRAIDERTRTLFSAGLVEETRRLVAAGYRDTPPMGSVGYRQALEVVEGRWTEQRALEAVLRETRRYAKRQLTWFRKEPRAQKLAPPYPVL
jgi:tRNA dimethylallyltransferase